MPKNEMHDKQKRKNWTLAGILLALIALIYAISMMKMKGV